MNIWWFGLVMYWLGFAIADTLATTKDRKGFMSKKPDNTTIRISTEVYDKLRALKLGRKKITFNRALEELLAASQRIESGEVRYVVGDQLFRDVAEARGASIIESVANQTPAQWPDIYVSIGKADPHAGE